MKIWGTVFISTYHSTGMCQAALQTLWSHNDQISEGTFPTLYSEYIKWMKSLIRYEVYDYEVYDYDSVPYQLVLDEKYISWYWMKSLIRYLNHCT